MVKNAAVQAYDVHVDCTTGHVHFQVLLPVDAKETAPLECAIKHLQLEELAGELTDKTITKLGSTQGPVGDQAKQIADVGYAIYKVHPAAG